MLILAFIQWWYGPGWVKQVRAISGRAQRIAEIFSLGILLRTLFAPWKQIIAETRGDQSVNLKMRAGLDNLISRFVGFSVRSIVLFVAVLGIIMATVFSLIFAIIWPILPSLILFLIPLGALS